MNRSSFLCLPCRKTVKRQWTETCPTCGGPMRNMGKKFKPPRKDNDRQWRKIEAILAGESGWVRRPPWSAWRRPQVESLAEIRRDQSTRLAAGRRNRKDKLGEWIRRPDGGFDRMVER